LESLQQQRQREAGESSSNEPNPFKDEKTSIDEVQSGVYRISTFAPAFGITFNQFLIDDEKPVLIHTGPSLIYPQVENRIKEVIDLSKLEYVLLLHFEADEWGGMPFLNSSKVKLICSKVGSGINLSWWHDLPKRNVGVWENDTISLGRKKLRFLMTPHVHHWDSMMVFEETEKALFPSDLFLQQGNNGAVTNDPKLAKGMIEQYRNIGIFASERPVRNVLPKLERLHPKMIHAMHGSSLDSSVYGVFFDSLRKEDFAYNKTLLFEEIPGDTISN
jgi:flavorubredoxin